VSAAPILKLSEIFTSLQGEGPSAGSPALFLRLALCNLRCEWCDTRYTWDFERYRYEDEVSEVSVDSVAERIASENPRRLIITGGEPLLQTRALEALLARLSTKIAVEVETNGTLTPSEALASRVSQWNVSPKLSHSGEAMERRIRLPALAALNDTGRAFLKLVVRTPAEREEIESLLSRLDWPRDRVCLMPEATTPAVHTERAPRVAELSQTLGLRFSPRLHVLLWGGERGR
jgi:organic radical activating enzyme